MLPLQCAWEYYASVEIIQFILHSNAILKIKHICDISFYSLKMDGLLHNLLIEFDNDYDYVDYYDYDEKVENVTRYCNLIQSTTLLELAIRKHNNSYGIEVIINRTFDFLNKDVVKEDKEEYKDSDFNIDDILEDYYDETNDKEMEENTDYYHLM